MADNVIHFLTFIEASARMGKGDLRSRRGKIYRGTFGKTRNKKALKARKRKRGKDQSGGQAQQ